MKKICSFEFKKNKREIATFYINKKELRKKKIHVQDAICLVFDAQNKDNDHKCYLRPDEALLIASMLTETVRKITKAYNLGVERTMS